MGPLGHRVPCPAVEVPADGWRRDSTGGGLGDCLDGMKWSDEAV